MWMPENIKPQPADSTGEQAVLPACYRMECAEGKPEAGLIRLWSFYIKGNKNFRPGVFEVTMGDVPIVMMCRNMFC